MQTAGLWMLLSVAILMMATGLPAWILLIGVALFFSIGGLALGTFTLPLLTAMPARLLGLLEHDLLQALPLYVFMGALLNRLPLADILFRVGTRMFARAGVPRGADMSLAGLSLGALLAPMNGSVGASVLMLARTVQPKLDAAGSPAEQSAALTCMASTMGIIVPPSLVLILLGDAMLRAHTEAVNASAFALGTTARIINTQDIFHAALVPAGLLLALCLLITLAKLMGRKPAFSLPLQPIAPEKINWREMLIAVCTTLFVVALMAGVALGYLYAVEAAATGGVALFWAGIASRTMTWPLLKNVLRDTMAVTGALFALLMAATMFTLVVRAFGTDRWVAAQLLGMEGSAYMTLAVVLGILAITAFVLDAFEMIFVVIPIVIPPLLMQVPDAPWVAVLTLLILQTSFLIPPFGYAVMMVRNRAPHHLHTSKLITALLPYLIAQLVVLAAVIAFPNMLWREAKVTLAPTATDPAPQESLQEMLDRQQSPGK